MAADVPTPPVGNQETPSSWIDTWVGIVVVILATFLGVCNVKDGNIVQKMQQAQNDRNNNWLWFQARNLREEMYRTASDQLRVSPAGPSEADKAAHDQMIAVYDKKARDQESKKETQKTAAEKAQQTYNELNKLDDLFDICEASLALALALMGVTALLKKAWMFFLSLVPAGFGVFMGIAGFAGWDVQLDKLPLVGKLVEMVL